MDHPEQVVAVVLGVADGILTALVLASAALLQAGPGPSLGLAFRVAVAAAVTNGFVFFVARYSEARGSLVRAEFQLNLHQHGRFWTAPDPLTGIGEGITTLT